MKYVNKNPDKIDKTLIIKTFNDFLIISKNIFYFKNGKFLSFFDLVEVYKLSLLNGINFDENLQNLIFFTRIFSSICVSFFCFTAYLLFFSFTKNRIYSITLGLVIICSPGTIFHLSQLRTELIAMFFLVLSILSLKTFLEEKFKEQQGLIVAHDDYGSILHDVFDSLGLNDKATVLEVGPGEGLLLTELAAKFKKLVALDNSKEMLEKSKEAIAKGKFNGVQFILGDTTIARKKDVLSDLIIFDMVLHHISSPTKTFKDSSALLNENGYLLIADLSTHDQDWVRESCGDLWLGFDETDLNHWAQKAGLVTGQSSYLGLRNGFQIQIRVFRKH